MDIRALAVVCAMWMAVSPVYGLDEYHRVGLDFGFAEDGYHLSLSYHYQLLEYVGLGGSIGYWSDGGSSGMLSELSEILEPYDPYDPWGRYDYYGPEAVFDGEMSFFVEPSVMLTTPKLRIKSCGFGLMAEPSVRFGTNRYAYASYRDGGKWSQVRYKCSNILFGIRGGLSVYVSQWVFTAGYMAQFGDMNRTYLSRRGYKCHPVQGFFIEAAVRF